MIFLFTDFGAADIYVGQVKAVLAAEAPAVPVIDLLHDAPAFNILAGAHLVAALATRLAAGSTVMAVVDPGVGGARDAVVLQADERWFVGPDNGLLSVVAARAETCSRWRITWRPGRLSASFHGRDLFAPIAASFARAAFPADTAEPVDKLNVDFGPADLGEIIYIDHYGNAVTGLRAGGVPQTTRFTIAGCTVAYARVFSEVKRGEPFWYENSLGLIEIAANASSAARNLRLEVGQPISYLA